MDYAETGEGPLPPELRLAFLCGDHLPDAGGYYDQDYVTMQRMRAYENTYRTVMHFRGATGDQIHTLTPGERRILRALRDEGLI